MSTQGINDDTPLPKLREDLRLLAQPKGSNGNGSLIFDPISHRYFEIDLETFRILSAWSRCKTVGELRSMLHTTWEQDAALDDIQALIRFLNESCLVLEADGGWRTYSNRAASAKPGMLAWLVHNYLYIRIPLLRPHTVLKATQPLVSFAFAPGFYLAIAAVGLVGLYLTSRQWDQFVASFAPLMSIEGAAMFAAAIAVVKFFHELGHAYTAMRFGCKIPSMGVALVVMLPMLYTDVTDAWKLPRREKMLIAGAGIIVELTLAALATFAWAFIPDGPMRSYAFIIATTSWITSIAINLNPLMRFDGYFLFADWIGVNNLQNRANALGIWRLRELLFGLGDPCPDKLVPPTRTWIVSYAWIVWLYRVTVFTGIALTVYYYFFKVLGVILFCVEILWFVLGPIIHELRFWWKNRARIAASRRSRVTFAAVIAAILMAVVPWSTHVTVPAIRESAVYARLYPAEASVITKVHVVDGQDVKAGDLLVELQSPRLVQDLRVVNLKINLLRLRRDRRAADKTDRAASMSLEKQIGTLEEQRDGLERKRAELMVRAPITGKVAELNNELHEGRWLARTEEIAVIVAPEHGAVVTGYLSNDDLARIRKGATGRFTPEDPFAAAEEVEVADVAYSAATAIEIPYLSSTFGGPVQVLEDKTRGPVPAHAAYLVTLKPASVSQSVGPVSRGTVVLDARAESFLASLWRQTLNVLVRESGV